MKESEIISISSGKKPRIIHFGEKGLNLLNARKKGFNVPDGILLSVEFLERYVDLSGIGKEIEDILQTGATGGKEINLKIEKLLLSRSRDESSESELIKAVSGIKDPASSGLFAVRSAALGEDGTAASFAGQYETVLDVKKEHIREAVIKCYSSWWTDRSIQYRKQNNIVSNSPAISIIIQAQVCPDFSGVLFTKNPVGNKDNVLIEAIRGIGEELVSGKIIPARWELSNSGEVNFIARPDPLHEAAVLPDDRVVALVKLGKNLEKHFKSGLDIEWAIKDNELFLLQYRPITTSLSNPDLINLSRNYYCRTIVEDLWSDKMTDITSSIIFDEFSDLYTFKEPLRKLKMDSIAGLQAVRVINGYGYINAEVIAMLLEYLPDTLRLREIKNSFPEEIRERVLGIRHIPKKALKILPRVPFLLNDLAIFPFLTTPLLKRHVSRITGKLNSIEDYTGLDLRSFHLELERLLSLMGSLQIRNQWGYGNASVLTWITYHLAIKFSGKSEEWILNKLTNIPDNVTLRIQKKLLEISRKCDQNIINDVFSLTDRDEAWEILSTRYPDHPVTRDIMNVVSEYKYRSANRDFIHPRWDEKPSLVLQHVALLIKSDFNKGNDQSTPDERNRKFNLAGILLFPFIRLTKRLLALREDLRFGLDIAFYRIRRLLIIISNSPEFSGMNNIPGWIFFVELNELRWILDNPSEVRSLLPKIKARMDIYSKDKDKSPPYYLRMEDGKVIDLADRSTAMHSFKGIPASPGIVEGRARIVRDDKDFQKLQNGDILIAYNTDPGWTPLFLLARGVVVEMGGILNHCAIVAREYGIPAVVGVSQITTRIQDDQYIRLNGNSGLIEILDVDN